jgi:transposase-like protein
MSIGIKHTKTEQRKIVNRTFGLVRNGHSITSARKTIAKEIGVSPNTLWVWQDKFGMTTPKVIKTTDLVKNHGTTRKSTALSTKSGTTVIKGLEIMKGKLGTVFTSLVDQDGRFSNQDATAISGLANVILGSCKQVLLERKALGKVNKTETLI